MNFDAVNTYQKVREKYVQFVLDYATGSQLHIVSVYLNF